MKGSYPVSGYLIGEELGIEAFCGFQSSNLTKGAEIYEELG
jgi:hypothetical protein